VHNQDWAQGRNLSLNGTKIKEIIFWAKGRSDNLTQLPATCPRTDRVELLLAICMLRVLRQHGLTSTSMNDVLRATVLAKLMYCAPAWSGFCSAADRQKLLDMFLCRCKQLCYSDDDIAEMAVRVPMRRCSAESYAMKACATVHPLCQRTTRQSTT